MTRYTLNGVDLFNSIERLAQYMVDNDKEHKQAYSFTDCKMAPLCDWEQSELNVYIRHYMPEV